MEEVNIPRIGVDICKPDFASAKRLVVTRWLLQILIN
jgi:hypothetical protein